MTTISTTYDQNKLETAIRNNARRDKNTCCQYGCRAWPAFVVASEVPTPGNPALPVCGLHVTWALRRALDDGRTSATVWPGPGI